MTDRGPEICGVCTADGGYGAGGYGGRNAGGPPQEVFESGPQGEVVVAVPDRAVGAIIGKGGEVGHGSDSAAHLRPVLEPGWHAPSKDATHSQAARKPEAPGLQRMAHTWLGCKCLLAGSAAAAGLAEMSLVCFWTYR